MNDDSEDPARRLLMGLTGVRSDGAVLSASDRARFLLEGVRRFARRAVRRIRGDAPSPLLEDCESALVARFLTNPFHGSSPGEAVRFVQQSAKNWYWSHCRSAYEQRIDRDRMTREWDDESNPDEEPSRRRTSDRPPDPHAPDLVVEGVDLARAVLRIPVMLKLLAGRSAPGSVRVVAYWIDSELAPAMEEVEAFIPWPSVDGPAATSNTAHTDRSRGRRLAAELVRAHPDAFSELEHGILGRLFAGTVAEDP